ncbi:MAG: hypothetical protein SCM11_02915 [Bacillota bacterium]|nr:hypothetical protein [Bacillota bacterium]
MYKSLCVQAYQLDGNTNQICLDIIDQQLKRKGFVRTDYENGQLIIILAIECSNKKESFQISRISESCIKISGSDFLGLIYGIGKFLHESEFEKDTMRPLDWIGRSTPDKEIRGIYFATHFHNFYHDAPLGEIKNYLNDLILWGINTLCVWFDMHHYSTIDHPLAHNMIERLRIIFGYARKINIKTCLLIIGNESFSGSPEDLRAQYSEGHDGYVRQLAGHYHVELCPSKREGFELLLQWRREVFEKFKDVKLDYILIWPYDQGGCTCSACKPWGANGFLKIAEPVAEKAKDMFYDTKIILSTWLFDSFTSGEWDGLWNRLEYKAPWVDYLLAEFLDGQLPTIIEMKGFPAQLPCLGFPEISMYGAVPWGGFGANPIPNHIQKTWDIAGKHLAGGFPYSEGIFDDINKVIYLSLYWDKHISSEEALKIYLSYEFGRKYVDNLIRAINLLEKSINRNRIDEKGTNHNYADSKIPWVGDQRFVIENTDGIDEAFTIISEINDLLDNEVKASWRWRIIFLRGLIDKELLHNAFITNEVIEIAYKELTGIYHAEQADYYVAPPSLQSIRENRGGFSWF